MELGSGFRLRAMAHSPKICSSTKLLDTLRGKKFCCDHWACLNRTIGSRNFMPCGWGYWQSSSYLKTMAKNHTITMLQAGRSSSGNYKCGHTGNFFLLILCNYVALMVIPLSMPRNNAVCSNSKTYLHMLHHRLVICTPKMFRYNIEMCARHPGSCRTSNPLCNQSIGMACDITKHT